MAPLEFLIAIFVLVFVGFTGARLLHVVSHLPRYLRAPRRLGDRLEGGMAMQGGLVLALAASMPLLNACQLPFSDFWDIVTIPALIWLIFGKIGCFLHGCCSGRPSAGAMSFDLPDHHGIWRRRVPVQLLESGLALLVLIGSVALWSARPHPGTVFLFALAVYSAGRFVLRSLREADHGIGSVGIQKALALLLLLLASFGLFCAPSTALMSNLMEGLL